MLIIAALLLLAGAACNRELDQAPVLTFDGEANMTIAELLNLHSVGSTDSYSEIPDGTIITGIITSSDEEGNCYKYLTIQDETGAIMIKVDDSSLFPKYQIGQRIYVKCGDMVIGDYRKNKQLGFWVDGSMTGIVSSQEDLYLFRDGLVGAEPEAVAVTSASQIGSSMYNRLVKLENCHFQTGGQENFCDAGSNTSRNIIMSDGSTVVLRTSSYAKFANMLLPEGEGDIYGIVTVYNTTVQFIIRSIKDIHFAAPTVTTDFNVVDFTNNPIENQGWSVKGDAGWFYYAAGQAFAVQNQSSEMIESWLVSPAIAMPAMHDVFLSMDDQMNASVNGQLEIYYSTTYNGGDIDISSWTRFNEGEVLPNNVTSSSNFRIAFRYHDANGANWKISDIKLKGVQQDITITSR